MRHFLLTGVVTAFFTVNFADVVFARATSFAPSANTFSRPAMPEGPIVSDDQPVLLTADQVEYLQEQDMVIATGKVEVVQGNTVVLADTLVYDRARDMVTVRGNVSVMDSVGNVIFADEAELRDELSRGVIREFKARLSDNSLFASRTAERVDENILRLDRAVYSPCRVKCVDEIEPGHSPTAPLWQLRAERAIIDQAEQKVTYRNAWMELLGYPVLYTPYMSHATPGADGKSGLMTPEFERNELLGNVYRFPIYYAIAPDKSALITPVKTSAEGLLVRGEYRQRFDQGLVKVDSSITRPRARDEFGNREPGREVRGHFYAQGEFNVDEDSRWGFDLKRTTDDTYMRKYGIDDQTLLMSRVYGETYDFVGTSNRNGLQVEGIAFQGLASSDDSDVIPLVLPLATFGYETEPDRYGGRYFIDSNTMFLTRNIGAKSHRLSNTIGWRMPYITENGQIIEFKSQLRGDIYDVQDNMLANGEIYSGVTGRLVPEASALWRYPFISQASKTNFVLEPAVNVALSPGGGNPEEIPNEDSLVPEFTDTNLFSDNRFAGYDRIEHGPRVSYGLRGLMNYRKLYIDGLFGQHYRMQEDRNFPFSNELNDNLSDYVGKLGVQLHPFYVAYRFRLDKVTLAPRRKEFDLQYGGRRLTFTTSYLELQNDPIFASREEIASSFNAEVTRNWEVGMGMRRDLLIDQLTDVGAQVLFKNECVNVSGVVTRKYTRDREVKPDTKYLMLLTLKNLN